MEIAEERRFLFTRNADDDITKIYNDSIAQWGNSVADRYITTLYIAFAEIAANPDVGLMRQYRSSPFLLYPAGKHFIVYDRTEQDIIVVAVLHQMQHVERIIQDSSVAFLKDIEQVRVTAVEKPA